MTKLSVYAVNINSLRNVQEKALSLITPDRKEKALRYRFEDDRLRCIAAGLLMRKYCGITSDKQINVGRHGKPAIKSREFNISHSGNWVVICIADSPVGVDIEQIRDFDQRVAKHSFCEQELDFIAQNQNNGFYMLWTRKESIIKAIGKGFNIPLNSFNTLPLDSTPHTYDCYTYTTQTKLFSDYSLSVTAFEPFDDFDIIIDNNII